MNWESFFPPDTKVMALPSGRSPRLYIPAANARQRWKRSNFFPAYRKSALAYKFLLRLGAAARPGSRIVNPEGVSWIVDEFVRDLKLNISSVSLLIGTEGPAQKLTLQLCDEIDNTVAYLKYGETPAAMAGIQNEQEILALLPEGLGPQLLKYDKFHQGVAMVTSSIDGSPVSATLPPPKNVVDFQMRLSGTSKFGADNHPGLSSLRNETTEPWIGQIGDAEWPVAIQHGDFAPWNLKSSNGRVCAFDWEYGSADGFPFVDTAFFSLQTDVKIYRSRPADAFHRASNILREMVDVSGQHAEAIVRLAAFDAYAKGLRDGHTEEAFLQQWYKGVWEAAA